LYDVAELLRDAACVCFQIPSRMLLGWKELTQRSIATDDGVCRVQLWRTHCKAGMYFPFDCQSWTQPRMLSDDFIGFSPCNRTT
jgi:hypothetical protein